MSDVSYEEAPTEADIEELSAMEALIVEEADRRDDPYFLDDLTIPDLPYEGLDVARSISSLQEAFCVQEAPVIDQEQALLLSGGATPVVMTPRMQSPDRESLDEFSLQEEQHITPVPDYYSPQEYSDTCESVPSSSPLPELPEDTGESISAVPAEDAFAVQQPEEPVASVESSFDWKDSADETETSAEENSQRAAIKRQEDQMVTVQEETSSAMEGAASSRADGPELQPGDEPIAKEFIVRGEEVGALAEISTTDMSTASISQVEIAEVDARSSPTLTADPSRADKVTPTHPDDAGKESAHPPDIEAEKTDSWNESSVVVPAESSTDDASAFVEDSSRPSESIKDRARESSQPMAGGGEESRVDTEVNLSLSRPEIDASAEGKVMLPIDQKEPQSTVSDESKPDVVGKPTSDHRGEDLSGQGAVDSIQLDSPINSEQQPDGQEPAASLETSNTSPDEKSETLDIKREEEQTMTVPEENLSSMEDLLPASITETSTQLVQETDKSIATAELLEIRRKSSDVILAEDSIQGLIDTNQLVASSDDVAAMAEISSTDLSTASINQIEIGEMGGSSPAAPIDSSKTDQAASNDSDNSTIVNPAMGSSESMTEANFHLGSGKPEESDVDTEANLSLSRPEVDASAEGKITLPTDKKESLSIEESVSDEIKLDEPTGDESMSGQEEIGSIQHSITSAAEHFEEAAAISVQQPNLQEPVISLESSKDSLDNISQSLVLNREEEQLVTEQEEIFTKMEDISASITQTSAQIVEETDRPIATAGLVESQRKSPEIIFAGDSIQDQIDESIAKDLVVSSGDVALAEISSIDLQTASINEVEISEMDPSSPTDSVDQIDQSQDERQGLDSQEQDRLRQEEESERLRLENERLKAEDEGMK